MDLHGLLQDSFAFYVGLSVTPPVASLQLKLCPLEHMVSQAIPYLQTALSRLRLQLGALRTQILIPVVG
jgi:hypothetical protein